MTRDGTFLIENGQVTRPLKNLRFTQSILEAFGRAVLSKYIVPFEIAAVLLLVVMIAAAYMARRRTE